VTIDRDAADAMLAEIAAIARRVRQSAIYRASGLILMFWGGVVVAGNVAGMFAGRWAGYSWAALDLLGVAGTLALLARTREGRALGPRMVAGVALFAAFGFAWSEVIGRFGPRELDAFWPTLFLFGYALAGLWLGRAFIAIGVGIAALVVAGYCWAGAAFEPYLAAVNGGGLVLCGLWMRRAG
jgi:MFS family permease